MLHYKTSICIWILYIFCFFQNTPMPTVKAAPSEYLDENNTLQDPSRNAHAERPELLYNSRFRFNQFVNNKERRKSAAVVGRNNIRSLTVTAENERTAHAEAKPDVNDWQPHEPAAASCSNGEHKYTHGQKVPREHPCEVCLCMDGEIFCWWENCVMKPMPEWKTGLDDVPSQRRTSGHIAESINSSLINNSNTHRDDRDPDDYAIKQYEPTTKNSKKHKVFQYMTTTMKQLKKKYRPKEQPQHQQGRNIQKMTMPLSASTSKILKFPENLPSVLYYDYKTEEHQHHQHEHHQKHLKHQQQQQLQRLREQQEAQIQNSANIYRKSPMGINANRNDKKRYDETETDSDILPEPPTKKPKQSQQTSFALKAKTITYSMDRHEGNGSTVRQTGPVDSSGFDKWPEVGRTAIASSQKLKTINHHRNDSDEDQDEAFHRWLTSTGANTSKKNDNYSYSYIDDTNFDMLHSIVSTTKPTNPTTTGKRQHKVTTKTGDSNEDVNSRDSNNAQLSLSTSTMGNAPGRADYSSEFNGSIVNIDILLTTASEYQLQKQQHQPNQEKPTYNEEQIPTKSIVFTADKTQSLRLTKSTTMRALTERQCNVMGVFYKIGDILPQDTGNCLQCICIDGSTSDDTPRVTCSPHNCPPLVLPDLFDATGY